MGIEEQAKDATEDTTPQTLPAGRMSSDEIVAGLRKAEAELATMQAKLKALEAEEKTFEWPEEYEEEVEHASQDLSKVSDEMLNQRAEVLAEQVVQAEKRIETNRRAVNLGLLIKANRTPRCNLFEEERAAVPGSGGEGRIALLLPSCRRRDQGASGNAD